MPYELLTDNKPNVSYFRVFGNKCYVLNKKPKSSKFPAKVYEGFLLGYDSNSHTYCVFSKDSGCVELTCDVVFDETNGTQVEQYDLDDIDDEEAPRDALRRMVVGDVRSHDLAEVQDSPSSNEATAPTKDNHEEQDDHQAQDNLQDQEEGNDQGGDEEEHDSRPKPPYPRVHQAIQRDHPIDNILGDIEKGVTTRSCVAIFCEHYSFVSSLEPFKVEDTLSDLD
jgi:hypothetical protein